MSAAQTLDVEKEALMDLSKGLVFKWERRQINRCCGYIRHISMQREREREYEHGLWHYDLSYLMILQWKEAMAPLC
jgi:hypothetical protein